MLTVVACKTATAPANRRTDVAGEAIEVGQQAAGEASDERHQQRRPSDAGAARKEIGAVHLAPALPAAVTAVASTFHVDSCTTPER